jgi:hypothetical protein
LSIVKLYKNIAVFYAIWLLTNPVNGQDAQKYPRPFLQICAFYLLTAARKCDIIKWGGGRDAGKNAAARVKT